MNNIFAKHCTLQFSACHVFLFDLATPILQQTAADPQIINLLHHVLSDGHRIKLGFDLRQDRTVLRSCKTWQGAFHEWTGVLDLAPLCRRHEAFSKSKQLPSLQSVVSNILHYQVSKSCQISDWTRRPLRPAQLQYAAIDAHILLRIVPHLVSLLDDEYDPNNSQYWKQLTATVTTHQASRDD